MRRGFLLPTALVFIWGAMLAAVSDGRGAMRRSTTTADDATALPAASTRVQAATPASSRVDYQKQILPILEANCFECHGGDQRKGGLSLQSYAEVLEGGKNGPIVRPGNSANSLVVHRITGVGGDQMPKDAAPLSAAEIALVARWIDEGARANPTASPAPPPWEAPLALTAPAVPPVVWRDWTSPADRIVAAYLRERGVAQPALVSDAIFIRRAYLDIWGLLPTPEEWQAFVSDRSVDKRAALVARLLADDEKYSEHWISFWNDLLRNEDGVNYYSEDASRRSITAWLLGALRVNLPYDQFVSALLNPAGPTDPDGFLIGVNWRGERSAAVTPWMQASQNASQIFLGVNLKCAACHDSFVNRWKLQDSYALASYFAPEGRLQLFRCDTAQDAYAEPAFLYPELNRAPASGSLADRRTAAAAIFTDSRNGRLPRTIVTRLWQRLLGAGLVAVPDEMDGRPWSPVLLDWLSADFVAHGYDVRHLIGQIVRSRAYQMPSVARSAEPPMRGYLFAGPEIRRLTAEQFGDAIGSITGEWGISRLNIPAPAALGVARGAGDAARGAGPAAPQPARGQGAGAAGGGATGGRGATAAMTTEATTAGRYVREWRMPSTNLSRALGRPVRDQVTSIRSVQATIPQALEMVNGDILNRWLLFGARRMLGQERPAPAALYHRAVAGRQARPVTFTVNVANRSTLWLLVQEQGSNDPARVLPVWARAELVDGSGAIAPLASLSPADSAGLRAGAGPITVSGASAEVVRVRNPSVLRYDVAGRGFTEFRGVMWLENSTADIGATLDPQVRFYVFGDEPNLERLIPPLAGAPFAAPTPPPTAAAAVDRVFRHALGRVPTAQERRLAEAALRDPARPERPSAEGLADVLWSLLMKPEFQFVY
jgi:mono/diheme cytochrome c family protein